MIKSIGSTQFNDQALSKMQSNILEAVNPLLKNPVSDGIILPNVIVGTSQTIIPHKLNRKLVGWYCVRIRGAAYVYDSQDANHNPESTLILTASSSVSVDLYVF